MKNIVILISGRGSNMEALIAARDAGNLPVNIAAVISNRPDAKGLETAQRAGIEAHFIDHKAFAGREAFDGALAECIDGFAPDLVVLAGFMRILSEGFVRRYEGRLINIHPSLLPSFPGLHTHQRALEEGVRIHGCTVHFVTPALDHGPVIIQAAVPVLDDDTEAMLAARILTQEHRIYPQAVRWFAEDKLRLENGRVRLAAGQNDGAALIAPEVR
ncbi:phosphoribosylglycinamide formyltransferase [Dechloromonas denitrificans]|uniref:Phosphoribosylglycinamide formyltransferase n=1 Tax=Dechloromonas denitrificans TaxID=281362 RepID=A0A133XJ39_9RHOO|nr:phosphoribosylglycinamide formyltransferase [Dechloromonas denitrificans]KXB30962.1 phosphoribosylglycinamide formyltransferase [Dechloromonas denitrificans]